MWAEIRDKAALARALECARGEYQRALLLGKEALSGSTLRGFASVYRWRYHRSRDNLLTRLTAAGIPWSETKGARGKRILVIG